MAIGRGFGQGARRHEQRVATEVGEHRYYLRSGGSEMLGKRVRLHGAACHACLFASETSCERGNKYLDRNLLVETFAGKTAPFFPREERIAQAAS